MVAARAGQRRPLTPGRSAASHGLIAMLRCQAPFSDGLAVTEGLLVACLCLQLVAPNAEMLSHTEHSAEQSGTAAARRQALGLRPTAEGVDLGVEEASESVMRAGPP